MKDRKNGMTIFEKNIRAIGEQDPELAERLLTLRPSPRVARSVDETGKVSIKVRAPGGEGTLRLPSLKTPRLNGMAGQIASARMAVILGFGSGGLFSEVASRSREQTFVLLIEPDIDAFASILREVDFSRALGQKRVSLSVGESPDAATFARAEEAYAVFTLSDFIVVENPWSAPLYREYFDKVKIKLEQLKEFGAQNLLTLSHMGKKWRENILKNLPAIIASPPVSALFGRYRGVPAFIVAAGPSLDKNARLLASLKGRALVIAVDTAARRLLAEGVEPDIVASLDAKDENHLHLAGVRMPNTVMALNPVANPKVVEESAGPMVFTGYAEPFFEWLEGFIGERGMIRAGGSVATSALDLAWKMGCSPIILVGQDLAYDSGRTHASGAIPNILGAPPEEALLDTKSLFGAPVRTTAKMNAWRKWFEIVISRESIHVLNATEGGVPIAGAENVSLAETISRHAAGRRMITPPARAMAKARPAAAGEAAAEALIQARDEARRVKSVCGRGISAIRGALSAMNENGAVAEAARERISQMKEHSRDILERRLFVEMNRWMVDAVLDTVEASWRRADGLEGRAGTLATIESFRALFSEMYGMAAQFEKLVDEALKTLTNTEKAGRYELSG